VSRYAACSYLPHYSILNVHDLAMLHIAVVAVNKMCHCKCSEASIIDLPGSFYLKWTLQYMRFIGLIYHIKHNGS